MRVAAIFAALVALAHCDTVTWTGQGTNNLWDNYANWDPAGIPNSGQDCVINTSANILIGTANGAQCQSLQIGDGVILRISGASATFGSLQITGHSSITVDAGASKVQINRASFVDQTVLNWSSGLIGGNYEFGSGVLVSVNTNRGFVQCIGGSTWYNKGTINILGGSQVDSCAIVNSGAVNLQSDAYPTTLLNLPIDPKSTGSVAVQGNVQIKSGTLNNLTIKGILSIIANGNVVLSNVLVSSQVKGGIAIAEPATVEISGLNCQGNLQVLGASADVHIVGGTNITSLSLSLGKLTFQNQAVISQASTSGGRLTFQDSTTIGDFSSDATVLTGGGIVTIQRAQITSPTQISTTLSIARKLDINARQITLDGSITIQPSGVLTIAGTPAFWGPTNPVRPGLLRNNGQLIVAYPNVTMNSISYSGSGSLWLLDATADFQAMNISTPIAGLNTSTSVIKGESFMFSYNQLRGPRSGSTIGILFDQNYNTCQSPCSNASPRQPAQTYWARVSRA